MTKADIAKKMERWGNQFISWYDADTRWYYLCNGFSIIRDRVAVDGVEYSDNGINNPNAMYHDYDTCIEIPINKDALKARLKGQRQHEMVSPDEAFYINYKGYLMRFNPWFLRDACEYAMNYTICIEYDYAKAGVGARFAPVWLFSKDYTIEIALCPIKVSDISNHLASADMIIDTDAKKNKLF